MNSPLYPQGWFPVATSKELKKKPLHRQICGTMIVLYRTQDDGIACLHDRCPHRSAQLSSGKVVDGEIECPYHGWRFNEVGKCTTIPFHEGDLPNRFVPTLPAREQEGLIFVRHGQGDENIYSPFWKGTAKTMKRIIPTSAETNLLNIMENVLDPTHTVFIHKTLMRGMNDQRQEIEIQLTEIDGRLRLVFSGEKQQNGLISRLVESSRSDNITNIMLPGIVEIEFWQNDRLNLVTTIYFSPANPDKTNGFIVLTTNKDYGLAHLKSLIFLPIFNKIIRQDQDILKSSHKNWKAFGSPQNATSPMDFMFPNVQALLEGKEIPVSKEPLSFVLKI